MLIAWGNVFVMAGVVTLATLLLLQLYRWQRPALPIAHSVGLALVAGAGFVAWFAVFNLLTLRALDNDLPIPLFPISPEDMGCGLTVLLLTLLYGLLIARTVGPNSHRWRQFGPLAWLLPTLVALVVDVYFI